MDQDLSSIYSQGEETSHNHDHNSKYKRENIGKKSDSTLQLHVANNLIPSIDKCSELQNFLSKIKNKEWFNKILTDSTVYYNDDKLLWGPFLIIIFKDPDTKNISSLTLDKLGLTVFPCIDITNNSKYYSAIENLPQNEQNSNVKKTLAVSLLQKFAQLSNDQIQIIAPKYPLKFDYDQTYSGELASKCQLFTSLTPQKLGNKLKDVGFFSSNRSIKSVLLDVVYENNETYIDANNRLVFHLGEQLEQLFNPITEYSPEQTEFNYKPPDDESSIEDDGPLIKAIISELLQFQSNFTYNLVDFLQKVLITLRVRVLNEEIDGLSTVKLNRLFPPTIDEVTRINCIFLDSLKAAAPYGSLEILKACSLTIPYFYKAYTRHEAATKNFSKDIKLFLRNFRDILPENNTYTELKLETIIKGPQEKLIKLKLIIDRLYQNKKKWSSDKNRILAEKEYTNIIDVIDSFGKLDKPLSSYDTRVFTPSGKILTELAKGWPVELQYKWLKRRVVGVYDIIETSKSDNRYILVIFSDYIVFLSIIDFEKYYTSDGVHKPFIADILMNSLINEVPLPPKIPKLKVDKYSYIDNVFVSVFDENFLRFDSIKSDESFSVTCQLANSGSVSVSYVSDLITKAKILEKDTAFHLFKVIENDITMYSTAHELDTYNKERIKSPFALFLNIKPDSSFLTTHKLQLAIFAEFSNKTNEEEVVKFTILSVNEDQLIVKLPSTEIVTEIIRNISKYVVSYYSSIRSPYIKDLMNCNICLLNDIKNISDDHLSSQSDDSSQKFILQQVNSENKKSYGTITTFRSNKSDLKDIESEDNYERNKITTPIKIKQKIPKSNAKQRQPLKKKETNRKNNKSTPNILYKDKEKKNKFFSIFKSIFGKPKDKPKKAKISKPIAVRGQRLDIKNNQNVNTIPTPNSMKKIQTPIEGNRLSKINLPSIIEKSSTKDNDKKKTATETSMDNPTKPLNEESTLQARISSVVRNTDFVKDKESVENETKPNTVSRNFNKVMSDKDSKSLNKEYKEKINPIEISTSKDENAINTTSMELTGITEKPNIAEKLESSNSLIHSKSFENDDMLPNALPKYTIASREDPNTSNGRNELSELDITETSQSTIKTRDIVNKGLSGDISTQSQVFNNALFGDFIEDIPKIKKKTHNTKNAHTKEEFGNKIGENYTNTPTTAITPVESIPSYESVSTIKTQKSENPHVNTNTEPESITTTTEPKTSPNISIAEDKEKSIINEPNKFQAFPQLPNIKISKPLVSFERSPSFIELFQGMRMVLDEEDAKYNWKRIPSASSLNNELLLGQKEQRFKMESVPEESSEYNNNITSIDQVQHFSTANSDKSITVGKNIDENVKEKKRFVEDSINSDTTENLDKSVTEMVNSIFFESSSQKQRSKSPSFKVVHSSPSRYVNQKFLQDEYSPNSIINNTSSPLKNIETTISVEKSPINRFFEKNANIDSEFSFPSEINAGPDKRLLELSFTSQEELKEFYNPSTESLDNKPYLTPSEEPEDIFYNTRISNQTESTINKNDTLEASDSNVTRNKLGEDSINDTTIQSSDVGNTPTKQEFDNTASLPNTISLKRDNNQSSNIMTMRCPQEEEEVHSLLDDLEFSSFNMTFGSMTNNDAPDIDNKNYQIDNTIQDQSLVADIWKKVPKLEQRQKGPIVYRLSRDLMSGISPIGNKGVGNSNSLVNKTNEEDPIWVSPSKINFALSPEKNINDTNKQSSSTNDMLKRGKSFDSKNGDLVEDSSFTFLADIISGTNLANSTIFNQDTSDISSESDVDYQNDKPERLHFIK